MSKIKKGDLVIVARPTRCGCVHEIGVVFKVTGFAPGEAFNCQSCGARWLSAIKGVTGYQDYMFDPSRLRKIDPDQASDREREFDRLNRRQPEVA